MLTYSRKCVSNKYMHELLVPRMSHKFRFSYTKCCSFEGSPVKCLFWLYIHKRWILTRIWCLIPIKLWVSRERQKHSLYVRNIGFRNRASQVFGDSTTFETTNVTCWEDRLQGGSDFWFCFDGQHGRLYIVGRTYFSINCAFYSNSQYTIPCLRHQPTDLKWIITLAYQMFNTT